MSAQPFNPFAPSAPSANHDNELFLALSERLATAAIDLVNSISEFSTQELKAISFLSPNRFIRPFLVNYIANKKHIKRKHAKEILEFVQSLSGFMSRMSAPTSIGVVR